MKKSDLSKYRVLVGQHIGPDYTKESTITTYKDRKGKEVKEERWPSKTYNQGETVLSPIDLVARFGASKFQLIGSRKMAEEDEELTPVYTNVVPAEAPARQESDEDEEPEEEAAPTPPPPPQPPVTRQRPAPRQRR